MNRRRFVAAATAGAVGASAGCLSDFIDDVTTFEAEPARVTEEAADEAEYEYQGTDELVEEREFAGESVEATSYNSEYTRPIDLPVDFLDGAAEAGVFAVISTPQVHVAGESFNPVGDMSEAEIAEHVQTQYDELEIGSNVGGRSPEMEVLELTASIETYEGTATLNGEQGVDVLVDISQPDHGDDHLVIVGVYPDEEALELSPDQEFSAEAEADRIDTLIGGLEHGDDVEVDIRETEDDGDESDDE